MTGLERRADSWGRTPPALSPKLPRTASMSRLEAWVWVFLRGFVFVPGALMGLALAFGLGYGGYNAVIVYAHLLWVPVAIVCWVQASCGKAGDRWTAGFVALWALELGGMRVGSWII